ncbi:MULTISPECIES: diaminopimelate epimerase [Halolamina]|uniref:Diaminopimelate epimerase n=1 Tax=Halolamina pelagica TaxID=699431 RepID=A0A1I5NJN4_9EURY|nr:MULTISPECIES: diaminopimelate epimerase [Halolamina]NHX36347.1 diaminopimelate epimerase [Halolamina sp. R1-12]SFP21937.1 diaminopimelate epimerase [Halolamina pelagica]
MSVPFEKYDGAGNDFVVVDADDGAVEDRAAFARAHCDRETGVVDGAGGRRGADGVLFLSLDGDTDPATVTMTLVQPDGSVAEMCGNGARCVAAWAADRSGASTVAIDTPAGRRRAVVEEEVAVEMGTPTFDPGAVPLAGDDPAIDATLDELDGTPAAGLSVTAVNTGVPHAVVFVDDVEAVDIDAVAPPIRHADTFPEGANVTFAAREGDGYRQRTFERGVEGETRACGTGAVAVAAAAARLGHLSDAGETNWVTVTPPGGELGVAVPDDGPARLRGPAEKRFEGELPVPGGEQ